MVFLILIGAAIFSLVFRGFGGDAHIEAFFEGLGGGPHMALLIVMLVMFLLGGVSPLKPLYFFCWGACTGVRRPRKESWRSVEQNDSCVSPKCDLFLCLAFPACLLSAHTFTGGARSCY